jgi:hypothetical protein
MIQMRCMEQCTPANKAGCLSFASGRLRVQRMCDPAGIPGGVFLLLGSSPPQIVRARMTVKIMERVGFGVQ